MNTDNSQASPVTIRNLTLLGLALLAVWVLLACYHELGCDDHYWHYLTGQIIAQNGSIPDTDPFSYTFADHSWTNWEWLGSLIIYVVWSVDLDLGPVLLRLLIYILMLAALLAHAGLAEKEEGRPAVAWRFLLLLLVLAVVFPRFSDRPHTLVFPLWTLSHLLAERARLYRKNGGLLLLIPLTALWVNLHPSWTISLVIVGASWCNELGQRIRSERFFDVLLGSYRWPLTLLGMLAAAFVNPHTFEVLLPFPTVMSEQVSAEWGAFADFLSFTGPIGLKLFLLLLLFVAASFLLAGNKRRIGDWLLMASLGVMAILHARFTAEFALLAYPILIRNLGGWRVGRIADMRPVFSVVILLLSVLLFTGVTRVEMLAMGTPPGVGPSPQLHPIGAVNYITRHDLRARPLTNTFCGADYLLYRRWPKQRIFIDGRVPTLYPTEFLNRFRSLGDPKELDRTLCEYEIGLVMIDEGYRIAPNRTIAEHLWDSAEWRLLYYDDRNLLFGRCDLLSKDFCERQAYRILNPMQTDPAYLRQVDSEVAWENLLADVARSVQDNPEDALAPRALLTRMVAIEPFPSEQILNRIAAFASDPKLPAQIRQAIAKGLQVFKHPAAEKLGQ